MNAPDRWVWLFCLFCSVMLPWWLLRCVSQGTFPDCLSSSHLHVSVSVPCHLPDLFVTYLLLLATLPILLRPAYYIPLHPIPFHLMTDMPWTKNGESAAASWNGNRYRDASAPPPAVNVPRKYFTPASCLVFYFVPLGRPERDVISCCHMKQLFISIGLLYADIICVYRTEAFILGEGEKKIEEKADTRMYPFVLALTIFKTNIRTGTPSTSIFTINKEDHSVGNLLRGRLLQNRHVTFAAYKVCCPILSDVESRD